MCLNWACLSKKGSRNSSQLCTGGHKVCKARRVAGALLLRGRRARLPFNLFGGDSRAKRVESNADAIRNLLDPSAQWLVPSMPALEDTLPSIQEINSLVLGKVRFSCNKATSLLPSTAPSGWAGCCTHAIVCHPLHQTCLMDGAELPIKVG